ncbi:alpha/beta-hydrolase [Rickenella mellea]|uniref:Alpha/beta-hydrolase n=1 Tax=Rickenella mellea TaxID=50990 RepID=A0A4Y7QGE0_9AGAM|nr:alpha/beta-hydrolase [Rickenella mellea]
MSFCKDCISGVRHEGTPTGKIQKIGGVDTYVALPESDYPKDKAILYLPDVLGLSFKNAQLLADDFAKNGFQVYIPDYLNGDYVPPDFLGSNFDLNSWLGKHGADKTRPPLDKVVNALKEKGITTFGATGYCFGGRYVFDLAFDNVIKVAVVSHPSLLQVPEDLEKYSKTNVPLLINSCEVDSAYGPERQAIGDQLLGGGKFAPGYKRTYWPGCTHGFAVRGDISNPQVKEGREGAFKASVEWFIQYL